MLEVFRGVVTHQYDLVNEVFEDKKDKLSVSLKPIENRIGKIRKAVQGIDGRSEEIDKQLAAIKMEIEQKVVFVLFDCTVVTDQFHACLTVEL